MEFSTFGENVGLYGFLSKVPYALKYFMMTFLGNNSQYILTNLRSFWILSSSQFLLIFHQIWLSLLIYFIFCWFILKRFKKVYFKVEWLQKSFLYSKIVMKPFLWNGFAVEFGRFYMWSYNLYLYCFCIDSKNALVPYNSQFNNIIYFLS